jgi:glutaredoxin 3
MEVQIYTKTDCPFCVQAKQWFKEFNIDVIEHCMDVEEDRLSFFQRINHNQEQLGEKLPQINTVPQIFVDGSRIGGYAELLKKQETILKGRGGSLTKLSETYKPFYYPFAVTDWKMNKITKVEKDYITNILRLFTQSDVAVGQNYYDQFIPKFKNNEVRNMLGSFANREGVHQRAYALLNDTLGLPDSEYHAFLEYKEMANKIEYMQKSDNSTHSFIRIICYVT